MRAIMAQQIDTLRIHRRYHGDIGIGLDLARQINDLAIDFPGQGFFGQRFGNRFGKGEPVNRAVKLTCRAIGQSQHYHFLSAFISAGFTLQGAYQAAREISTGTGSKPCPAPNFSNG